MNKANRRCLNGEELRNPFLGQSIYNLRSDPEIRDLQSFVTVRAANLLVVRVIALDSELRRARNRRRAEIQRSGIRVNGSGSVAGDTVPVGGEPARKRLDGGESGEEAARDYGRGSSENHTAGHVVEIDEEVCVFRFSSD